MLECLGHGHKVSDGYDVVAKILDAVIMTYLVMFRSGSH